MINMEYYQGVRKRVQKYPRTARYKMVAQDIFFKITNEKVYELDRNVGSQWKRSELDKDDLMSLFRNYSAVDLNILRKFYGVEKW